jgi:hypothetical protein
MPKAVPSTNRQLSIKTVIPSSPSTTKTATIDINNVHSSSTATANLVTTSTSQLTKQAAAEVLNEYIKTYNIAKETEKKYNFNLPLVNFYQTENIQQLADQIQRVTGIRNSNELYHFTHQVLKNTSEVIPFKGTLQNLDVKVYCQVDKKESKDIKIQCSLISDPQWYRQYINMMSMVVKMTDEDFAAKYLHLDNFDPQKESLYQYFQEHPEYQDYIAQQLYQFHYVKWLLFKNFLWDYVIQHYHDQLLQTIQSSRLGVDTINISHDRLTPIVKYEENYICYPCLDALYRWKQIKGENKTVLKDISDLRQYKPAAGGVYVLSQENIENKELTAYIQLPDKFTVFRTYNLDLPGGLVIDVMSHYPDPYIQYLALLAVRNETRIPTAEYVLFGEEPINILGYPWITDIIGGAPLSMFPTPIRMWNPFKPVLPDTEEGWFKIWKKKELFKIS